MKTSGDRGQSLIETLLAIGVFLLALGAATAALTFGATHERPAEARLIALDVIGDAATELFAATAYDPIALQRVHSATWTVTPPAPPSPAPSADGASLELSASVAPAGQAQLVQLHATGLATSADAAFALRFVAPPPGAILDASSPPPSPH